MNQVSDKLETLYLIQEGYVISDNTISIDFDKFKKGGRLFIIGLSGSGKTTVGQSLQKRFKSNICHLDGCWNQFKRSSDSIPEPLEGQSEEDMYDEVDNCMKEVILDKRGCRIVEGIQLMTMERYWNLMMKEACIIMGKSAIKAAYDAATRDRKYGRSFVKTLGHAFNNNRKLTAQVDKFKKARIKSGGVMKDFIL